jgi:uncharacterized membrane protein
MRSSKTNIDRTVATRAMEDEESPSTYPESSYSADDASGETGKSRGRRNGAGTTASPAAVDPRSVAGAAETSARGVRKPPVPSVAAIAGHPLHPMLVPLPIGAFTFALAADVAYAATRDPFWARASSVLLGAGIATGLAAGALGATDFTGREQVRSHQEAWLHAGGNLAALGLAGVSLAARRANPERNVVPLGLGLSVLTGSILMVTGWLGGELSYRHRIGVTAD